jgi:uncharacterized membrane protein YeaQ/YmgE (transglycosylase-associated protein family)
MHFIAFLVFGLVVGLIARAVMPGRQKLGLIMTSLLGMAGSLLGGFLGILLFGGRPGEPIAAGWIGSIIGALLLLGIAAGTRRTSRIWKRWSDAGVFWFPSRRSSSSSPE